MRTLLSAVIKILITGLIFTISSTHASESTESRVEALLAKMTLTEKIGQMNQYNGFWDVTGPAPSEGDAKNKHDHIRTGLVGSVLNVSGVEDVRALQKLAVEGSRLGIPLLFGLDVIHGHRTVFPIPLAEAASWDLDAIELSARLSAVEASARGINWTFAPMVDISRDARWGRVMEGAGEDTYLAQKVAVARVRGFQGDDLSRADTIAATAKHFAGYGFAEAGRDYNTVDLGTPTLYNVVLPPFKASVDAGVATIMNAFNILNGVPATGDTFLQRDILKGQWGFQGFVISDWGSGKEMVLHGFANDLEHAAQLAVTAGSDMDMESYMYIKHLETLVASGKVNETLIDDAVRRILKVKFDLGLFDDPYRYADSVRESTLINHPKHHAAALDVAKKSMVLLKNENQLLPLSKTKGKLAIIGDLADDKNSPLGSWRIGSIDNTAVSLTEAVARYRQDIPFEQGVKLSVGEESFLQEIVVNETDRSGIAEAVALAKQVDTVVMMLGEHGFQSGEGRSRTDLGLPGLQQELLEAVHAANPNIVLLLSTGRPLALPWAAEHIPAILVTWQLGTQSGNAIAEVLFGDHNPAGKLPVSFPYNVGQMPLYYNRMNTGRPANVDGNVFWSHYIDSPSDALFPFGFGLSYTRFELSNLRIDASDKSAVRVSVDVANTGKRAGEEVVQLYLHDRVASIARPVKELKGFRKVAIEPGANQTVEFILNDETLGFFNQHGEWLVEAGEFGVMVGTSSRQGLRGEFSL
ncbi:glycosyl hydrolase [Arenicella chitinivorans]|uniref:beta-glucosidase n=1 Tax=Arenicella chitinivorans TaxID=1329800 RepID=A0A918VLZ1_9GAMM|nr:beta-glucosidase BglX [Arenicella chitinivorans]GHA12027.1 glycosyl hydrolase [Arenicella chitinivorans]